MKLTWTKPAARALASIQDYIARDNPKAAYEVIQTIRLSVIQLSEHPKLGREGRIKGTRELVIANLPYIVPYRIVENEIQILSVYHGARKWPDNFDL